MSDDTYSDDSIFDDLVIGEDEDGVPSLGVLNRDDPLPSSSSHGSSYALPLVNPTSEPTGPVSDWPSSQPPPSDPPSDALRSLGLEADDERLLTESIPPQTNQAGTLRNRCQGLVLGRTRSASKHEENGPALCAKILARYQYTPVGWCRLIRLQTNKDGGYAQVSYAGCNKFATAGELVLWSKGEAKTEPGALSSAGSSAPSVSHLCHHPRCTVPEHICVESIGDNNDRKGCLVWTPCIPDCPRCSGRKVIWLCPHSPCCVKAHDGWSSQREFRQSAICRDHGASSGESLRKRKSDNLTGVPLKRGRMGESSTSKSGAS